MSSSTGPDGGLPPGSPPPGPSRSSRTARTPYAVLEALRLMVVVFFAGAGYSIGSVLVRRV